MVILLGVILFLPNEKEQILIEDKNEENTNLVFMLQDEEGNYNKSDTLPSMGYTLNASKSVCSNNTTPTWEDNKLYLNNLTRNGTSCYLYFDIKPLAMNTILANSTVHEGTPDFSQVATADEGMYKVEDDLGMSYYFRGAVENNYVKFAGYWWRIVRINGNGSIRLIYDGTSAHANGESSTDRQIGTSDYNNSANASYYVGYTYQVDAQRPSTQNGGTASTIKGVLDSWYSNNLQNYDSQIVNSPGFCNDRDLQNGSWVVNGSEFYYSSFERLYTNKQPTFECENDSDLYTTSGSSNGNKALQYPIGLISMDEMSFAGEVSEITNSTFYLRTTLSYWTMTPSTMAFDGARMYISKTNNSVSTARTSAAHGVRPVINLKADVQLTGTGTSTDPYKLA